MEYTIFFDNTKYGADVFDEHFEAETREEAMDRFEDYIRTAGNKPGAIFSFAEGNLQYGDDFDDIAKASFDKDGRREE